MIMKKFFLMLVSISLTVMACTKGENPPLGTDPDETGGGDETPTETLFNVKLENNIFKVGDQVEFKLEGDPEKIDFFSGLPGREYEFREGTPMPSGMKLEFQLHFSLNATNWPGEITWEPFSIMVSTDFDGDYSFDKIQDATWEDVSDRLRYPTDRTYQQVGPVDLSDLTEIDKPFYFAIKYTNIEGRPQYGIQKPIWYSVLPTGDEAIARMRHTNHADGFENSFGFVIVNEDDSYPATSVIPVASTDGDARYNDRFTIRGHSNSNARDLQTWVVSKAFNDVQEVMAGGSVPIPIKSAGNSALSSYVQVYSEPGTYKAYFVATVLDEKGERHEEVKYVTVTIEE